MPPATFRLILLISCAHALVHTFELALPAVEQLIGEEFGVGKDVTGQLGMVWRLPFGLAAIGAGWLADRYGSRLLLIVYLLGCSATAVAVWWAPTLTVVFVVMFVMGCFASIYHPAGLALISRETTPETRGTALGWHGILGSIGIAGAPFLASIVFEQHLGDWRGYYVMLTIPAFVIAALLLRSLLASTERHEARERSDRGIVSREPIHWRSFVVLVSAGALSGFVYAAFMHFLPRYVDTSNLRPDNWTPESFRNVLAATVLLCAAFGQALAGRLCGPGKLERLLILVLLGNIPPLLWMAFAEGPQRFIAACGLAFVHFMNQPVYNSLIAQHIPASRRSFGYGFSNMMCFGIGATGPMFAGRFTDDATVYSLLAAFAGVAGMLAIVVSRSTLASE